MYYCLNDKTALFNPKYKNFNVGLPAKVECGKLMLNTQQKQYSTIESLDKFVKMLKFLVFLSFRVSTRIYKPRLLIMFETELENFF